jgi:hypothetical protein
VPGLHELYDVLGQAFDPRSGLLDSAHVLRQHAIVGFLLKFLTTDPLQVLLRPSGFARIPAPVAQQKLREVVARNALSILRIVACALEVAYGFADLIVNVDRGQVAAAKEARKLHRVATVSLHAISRFLRHQRRRDDDAGHSRGGKRPVKTEPRGTRLVAAAKRRHRAHSLELLQYSLRLPCNSGHDLGSAPVALRHRDGDAVLVDVESDKT